MTVGSELGPGALQVRSGVGLGGPGTTSHHRLDLLDGARAGTETLRATLYKHNKKYGTLEVSFGRRMRMRHRNIYYEHRRSYIKKYTCNDWRRKIA